MLIGHKKQWEFLKNKFESDQLSHSYLFTGAKEIGKKTFAVEFTKLVNCLSDSGKPCAKCVNCQMIEKNNFPDLMIVRPTDKDDNFGEGGDIKVAKIREVQNFLSYKAYYGLFKVVIVDDAECMNQEAQGCFLKTLEEPKGKTLIFLISSKPDMLLETITSRCQEVKFFRPKDLPENSERLEKEKAILKSLIPVINSDFAEKFKYTKTIDFQQQKLSDILEVIQKYLRHILLLETGVRNMKNEGNIFDELPVMKKYPVEKIKKIINLVEDINNKFLFTNSSPKLALEIILMEF